MHFELESIDCAEDRTKEKFKKYLGFKNKKIKIKFSNEDDGDDGNFFFSLVYIILY